MDFVFIKNIEINKTEASDNKNSEIETLKEKLNRAVKEENYEEAAKIRDKIKELKGGK
ncbi:UvrB/UvrC motif-containing protein [Treponema sp. UBA7567]|uniref:UvrB/UvrC motif-containing protein n=1 Tax=Treponema sp. UBA7567 TaxID=1947748 RepID=UPI0025DA77CE|nr:UvrB/UvrC motif-containing protein [Treponema sp. UBA7567]